MDITEQKKRIAAKAVSNNEEMGIFETILRSDLPPEEKATSRLAQEAGLILSAGTETTGWILSFIVYSLLSDHKVLERLTKELRTKMEGSSYIPPLSGLQSLPYLIS